MCIHAGAFVSLNCVDLIQIENIQNAFGKKIRNGFEVKEKREKENLKTKEFKKVVNFIFEDLLKFLTFS